MLTQLILQESHIIEGCLKHQRKAQYALYERYAPVMMTVCMRYCKSREEAEDLLQEGFIKVFQKISTFRGQGSLEGWIRRILVNHALNNIKARKLAITDEDPQKMGERLADESDPYEEELYTPEMMLKAIQALPDGYKVVFNLYVFENYSHKEIADSLGISENTSKSQLSRARAYLRKVLTGKE
jgi:RNA polymerase sigma factor (sigma-70 family)